jgi:cysteine desulfurase
MGSPTAHHYLDHNATSPVLPEVLDAMQRIWAEGVANPSSLHAPGRRARAALHEARAKAAAVLGAREHEIVFASGGTESIAIALRGLVEACSQPWHVLSSAVEHPAVRETIGGLEEDGTAVTVLPVDTIGRVSVDAVVKAVLPTTRVVSVMLANNEIGTRQPVREFASALAGSGILVHTDAVQAFGKIPVRADDLGVAALSLSGHKFGGPPGTGLLFLRDGVPLRPILRGGKQEHGRRAGTENVAGAVGLALAMQLAAERIDEWTRRVRASVVAFLERLESARIDFVANGPTPLSDDTLANTLNLAFHGVEAQAMLVHLDLAGVAASTGSACSSGAVEPSRVLRAIGLDDDRARASIRFSFGSEMNVEAAKDAACRVIDVVKRLRP